MAARLAELERRLAALDGRARVAESWLENGGAATLESYPVPLDASPADWHLSIPLAHRQWLTARALSPQEGGYLFVHAGIRPGRDILRQSADDLLWIREPFLSSNEIYPFVVVHGHTPASVPAVRPNRIGIDTGAVMGGRLTCLVLEEDGMRFLSA